MNTNDLLTVAGQQLESRLMLGTARYPSPAVLAECIDVAKPSVLTVSLRRSGPGGDSFYQLLQDSGCLLLPNTAGCRTATEAVNCAQMARELLGTNWIKLEVIGDNDTLQPNPFELCLAAEQLCAEGFSVFAYTIEDLVVCNRLQEIGCAAVMPWGSMIGSGGGIDHPNRLAILRNRLTDSVLVVDAGIGRPSDAALAMELGMDAVLLNTAVALAKDPPMMAQAFSEAINAGRNGWRAGMITRLSYAQPSTPQTDVPFWQEAEIPVKTKN